MKLDAILAEIGEFGPYQIRVFFLVGIAELFTAFQKLIWVFIGAAPLYRCQLPFETSNSSYSLPNDVLNVSIPWDSTQQDWSKCELLVNSDQSGITWNQKCDQWIFDTSQYTSTVTTEFSLVCQHAWLRSLAYTFYIIGEFTGGTLCGAVSDKIGRKKVVIFCLVAQGLFGIAAGLIKNLYIFFVLRLFVGICAQGLLTTCVVIGMELVGLSKRELTGISINYFFTFGYIFMGGLAYFVRDWRYLQIIGSIPGILYVVCTKWFPESARWLISQDRKEEALKILRKAAEVNKKTIPRELLQESAETHVITERAGLLDLLRHAYLRKVTAILGFIRFVITFVYYGLALNTSNLGGNDYLNFVFAALMEFPGYAICHFILPRFGRRFILASSNILGGLAMFAILFVPMHMTEITITLAMIGKLFNSTTYAVAMILAAEVYPTQVRNAAIGLNTTCSRLGSVVATFIVLLADTWRPLPLIIFGIFTFVAGLLAFLLPETKGKPLPDTIEEGKQLYACSKKMSDKAIPFSDKYEENYKM